MDLVHDRGSMDPVHESGPWTRSKEGVHEPLVHVLSSPSIFGSYLFLRIAWHDSFSLSDHFPASWNLYIPHDLAESKSKCSSSRQSNPDVNHRTHLKDSFMF